MKKVKILGLIAVSAIVTQFVLFASESKSSSTFDIQNRLRLEYDDNIYETSTDETDSFKIIEEIEIGVTIDLEPTFLTLRYRPSFTYWEEREPDDTDFHQDFDVVLNHEFSPRVSFGVKNVFRLAERAEQIDRGTTISDRDDYIYNVTDGNLDIQVLPRTHAVIGGRYTILEYDRDEISRTEDYDIVAVGLTLRHSVTEHSQFTVDVRYEDVNYDMVERGSESLYTGVGLEQQIGASFVGTVRGGYQNKEFDEEGIEDESSPYGDVTITYILSPRTRLSAGAGYSLFEADVFPYASQDRTIVFASVAHDLTAKLSLYLSGSYQVSDYKEDQKISDDIVDVDSVPAGEEEVVQGGARIAYRINAHNTLELNYQHLDLSSDIRDEFSRNRASIGWRLDI